MGGSISQTYRRTPLRPKDAGWPVCFRLPIAEIEQAAEELRQAALAHLAGDRQRANALLAQADKQIIWDWTDSVWGSRSAYVPYRLIPCQPSALPKAQRCVPRNVTAALRRAIHERDGFYCRFCQMPVIRAEVRARFAKAYPTAVPWGTASRMQHAAFQAMWAQYDHLIPHSRGGSTTLGNIVLTCAACNFGRDYYTLDEVGLDDPRERAPRCGPWDGLEGFNP